MPRLHDGYVFRPPISPPRGGGRNYHSHNSRGPQGTGWVYFTHPWRPSNRLRKKGCGRRAAKDRFVTASAGDRLILATPDAGSFVLTVALTLGFRAVFLQPANPAAPPASGAELAASPLNRLHRGDPAHGLAPNPLVQPPTAPIRAGNRRLPTRSAVRPETAYELRPDLGAVATTNPFCRPAAIIRRLWFPVAGQTGQQPRLGRLGHSRLDARRDLCRARLPRRFLGRVRGPGRTWGISLRRVRRRQPDPVIRLLFSPRCPAL